MEAVKGITKNDQVGVYEVNPYNISESVISEVNQRDTHCVYCGVELIAAVKYGESYKQVASLDHIVNDLALVGSDNIALCCFSCNSSKGAKKLEDWLKSAYCVSKGINESTVAPVVQKHLAKTSE